MCVVVKLGNGQGRPKGFYELGKQLSCSFMTQKNLNRRVLVFDFHPNAAHFFINKLKNRRELVL